MPTIRLRNVPILTGRGKNDYAIMEAAQAILNLTREMSSVINLK